LHDEGREAEIGQQIDERDHRHGDGDDAEILRAEQAREDRDREEAADAHDPFLQHRPEHADGGPVGERRARPPCRLRHALSSCTGVKPRACRAMREIFAERSLPSMGRSASHSLLVYPLCTVR
jgi:hypothetical protein